MYTPKEIVSQSAIFCKLLNMTGMESGFSRTKYSRDIKKAPFLRRLFLPELTIPSAIVVFLKLLDRHNGSEDRNGSTKKSDDKNQSITHFFIPPFIAITLK